MRSPVALLLVTPLLACFTDGGTTIIVTASGTTGAAEAGSTEPGTEGGTGASTSDGPTTVAPTTGAQTSDGPTTTGATTGAVGNCELAPECEAGMVETGALCDSCGVQRRTCQADCTWTPMACEQDLNTCAYWVLPTGQQEWQRVPVDPAAQFAPQETVLAAIGLAPQQQIFVLTATSYHALSTATRTWIAAGPRDTVFPEIAGMPLYHAAGITTMSPDTIINLVAGTEAFAYTFHGDGAYLSFDGKEPCCGDHWAGLNAPPDPYAVRDGWGGFGDPEDWIPGDPVALCNLDPPADFYGYGVAIGADGLVYPYDVGYCFDFYPPIPYDQFTPFTYPGRPANDLIGGAALADGLWIFRGE